MSRSSASRCGYTTLWYIWRLQGNLAQLGACSVWVMQKLSKAWPLGMEWKRWGRQGLVWYMPKQ